MYLQMVRYIQPFVIKISPVCPSYINNVLTVEWICPKIIYLVEENYTLYVVMVACVLKFDCICFFNYFLLLSAL